MSTTIRSLTMIAAVVATTLAAQLAALPVAGAAGERDITVAQGIDAEFLDVQMTNNIVTLIINTSIYDTLLTRDKQLQLVGNLAVGYKLVSEKVWEVKLRQGAVIHMPAWRKVLSEGEVDDLVAFVKAVSDLETPREEKASAGRDVATRMGCFNCHGPQGRGAMPNARAFKGYIPSWDGADFPDLAHDDGEIREWVLDGRPRRLQDNRLARFFLERQPIQMPAYRGHVAPADVDRLVDYIHWLRQHPY